MTTIREALAAAAQSLESIAEQAGKIGYMDDISTVRGYTRNRALVARAALAEQPAQALTDERVDGLINERPDMARCIAFDIVPRLAFAEIVRAVERAHGIGEQA